MSTDIEDNKPDWLQLHGRLEDIRENLLEELTELKRLYKTDAYYRHSIDIKNVELHLDSCDDILLGVMKQLIGEKR